MQPQLTHTHSTGGASGIGLAAVKILISKGARAFILDLRHPTDELPDAATFIHCDCSSWSSLLSAFRQIPHIDIAIANAGVSEDHDYLDDTYSEETGEMLEPRYRVIDVNLRGVLNFVKLAISGMRRRGKGGSVVITSSATAYAAEQSLPVYSATKAAVRIYPAPRKFPTVGPSHHCPNSAEARDYVADNSIVMTL